MHMVDIGGGFPGDNNGSYRKDMPSFPEIAKNVRKAINDFKEKITDNGNAPRALRFIAEPGRYFVYRSTTIATKIYGRKGGKKDDQQVLYVDDGCYGSFNNVIYDHAHPVPKTLKSSLPSFTSDDQVTTSMPTAIFGPTCDGID